jgi:hypothetical protein
MAWATYAVVCLGGVQGLPLPLTTSAPAPTR